MEMPVRGTKEYWEWLKGIEAMKGLPSSKVYEVKYTVHIRYLNKPLAMSKRTQIRVGDSARKLEQIFKDRFLVRAEMEYSAWGPNTDIVDVTIDSFYRIY